MPIIIMGDALEIDQAHGHHRLSALRREHLAFLVRAQHQGIARQLQIQSDDIADFFDEESVAGQLERLAAMGLQTEQAEVALTVLFETPVSPATLRTLQ